MSDDHELPMQAAGHVNLRSIGQTLGQEFQTAIFHAQPIELEAWQYENSRYLIWAHDWKLFEQGGESLGARLSTERLLTNFLTRLLTDLLKCLQQFNTAVGVADAPVGSDAADDVVSTLREAELTAPQDEQDEQDEHSVTGFEEDYEDDDTADDYVEMPESLLTLGVATSIIDRLYRSSKLLRKAWNMNGLNARESSSVGLETISGPLGNSIVSNAKSLESERMEPKHNLIAEQYYGVLFELSRVHLQVKLHDIPPTNVPGPQSAEGSLPPSSIFSAEDSIQSMTSATSSPAIFPRDSPGYQFAFRIRYITANPPLDVPHQAVLTVGNHFRPPTNRAHFQVDSRRYISPDPGFSTSRRYTQDQVFLWRPGQVTPLSADRRRRVSLYRSTSLFWCGDRMGYLVVPFDCTQHNVQPYPDHEIKLYDSDDEGTAASEVSDTNILEAAGILISWRRLTFGRQNPDDALSRVGYFQEYYKLGAKQPAQWNNFLIPPTQSRMYSSAGHDEDQTTKQCSLAGDLGALLGLCAFSSSIDRTVRTIRDSFRPKASSTDWARPTYAIPFHERAYDRGVVVDIYCDNSESSRQNLHDWEEGKYGPILT